MNFEGVGDIIAEISNPKYKKIKLYIYQKMKIKDN